MKAQAGEAASVVVLAESYTVEVDLGDKVGKNDDRPAAGESG